MIEDTPSVQRQSASADPEIATAPRSVVQIPMSDGEQTGFPQVSAPASAAVQVPEEEEENNSSSVRKQKAGATKRQTLLSECMHAAGSQGIQSISSRKST